MSEKEYERVILVLGGGGMKGLANAGAWRALTESGLAVSEVIGTSIGALIGACIGGGMGWPEMEAQALALEKTDLVVLNRWALLLNGIRQPSVFRGDTLQEYIARVVPPSRFEDLEIPVSMNAVDLETGREEWFGAGGRTDVDVHDAIYASCALPLFFPPAEIGDRLFVDGGVADPLPVTRAAERGADLIVAIDVGAGPVKDSKDTVSQGLVAIHHRVYDIMAYARKREVLDAWDGPPLLYVRPELDGYSTFDFASTRYFLDEGYRATRSALAAFGISSREIDRAG